MRTFIIVISVFSIMTWIVGAIKVHIDWSIGDIGQPTGEINSKKDLTDLVFSVVFWPLCVIKWWRKLPSDKTKEDEL